MELDKALQHLYPNIVFSSAFSLNDNSPYDVKLSDDGDGQYISEWNLTDPEPTEEELLQAYDAYMTNPPEPPKTDFQILGEQLVMKDIEIMELRQMNDSLGSQVVDHDIRLMMGGL